MNNLANVMLDHKLASSKVWLACACLAAMAGCASTPPPTAQLAVSAAAVSHASAANSADYAPVEMKAARDKLDQANAAMTSKDYDLAMSLAQESQVDAQLAEAKTHTLVAKKAADEVKEGRRVLREELDRKTN